MDYIQKAPKLRNMLALFTCLNVPERDWYQSDASGIGDSTGLVLAQLLS